jgi:CRP-like cAMP-binding protein
VVSRDHPLAERIVDLVPINGLSEQLQDQALASGEVLDFRRRRTVFKAGARDPYTFYLLEGVLELRAAGASPMRMHAGDENARRALAQLQPRRYTAVAVTPVQIFRIERAVLDHILSDEQLIDNGNIVEVEEIDEAEEENDWMSRLLRSALFTRLPGENIQRFFSELEPMQTEKDEVVVEQGTPGDHLYIVAQGRCALVRRAAASGREVQLSVLKEGDTFGEESIISNSPSNAALRMLTPGIVMRLPRLAFEELVSNPSLRAVTWSEASQMGAAGAHWLDVRFSDEFQADAVEGSVNMPLNTLRMQADKLATDNTYIVVCDTGARSSTAAFLLSRMGFETVYLAGGLERRPAGDGEVVPPSIDDEVAPSTEFAFEFASTETEETETEEAAEPDEAETEEAQARAPQTEAPPAEPAPAPPAQGTPSSGGLSRVRAQVAQIKAERDKAKAYGKKAARAAKELKRQAGELRDQLAEARGQRETLDKALAQSQADAECQLTLERTRLEGELAKLVRRLEALSQAREQEVAEARGLQQRLQAQLQESETRVQALRAEKEQFESTRGASEAALQESLGRAKAEMADLGRRLERAEKTAGEARERLSEAEAQAQESRAAEGAADMAVRELEQRLRAEREALDAERARVAEELRHAQELRQKEEASQHAERQSLEQEVAAQRARTEELDAREAALASEREALTRNHEEHGDTLHRREQDLVEREAELTREKEAWKETVEQAIAWERKNLDATYARYREEAAEEARKTAETTFAERIEELETELELRETQMRGQVDAHVAKVKADFETRLTWMRKGYETRLTEQEALLEDERRRLEAEVVRLREALADALEATAHRAPATRVAPMAAAAAAPDLSLNVGAAPALNRSARPSSVPALDVEVEASVAPGEIPPMTARKKPGEDSDDDEHRVIPANTLAEIRRKMEKKMRTTKRQAG